MTGQTLLYVGSPLTIDKTNSTPTNASRRVTHAIECVEIEIEPPELGLRPGILWQLAVGKLLDLFRHGLIASDRLHGARTLHHPPRTQA